MRKDQAGRHLWSVRPSLQLGTGLAFDDPFSQCIFFIINVLGWQELLRLHTTPVSDQPAVYMRHRIGPEVDHAADSIL